MNQGETRGRASTPLDYYMCIIIFVINFNISFGDVLIYRVFLLHVFQHSGRGKLTILLCEIRFVDCYFYCSLLFLLISMG
jgi:hypothetical protein